jgi:regulatory protein
MEFVSEIRRSEDSNEAVVVCGSESYRITIYDLERLDIEVGTEVKDEMLEAVNGYVIRLKCIKKAFDYLSYGDLSEKQLRDKLKKKFSPDLAEDVAALFVERGYVDDARLAARYAETFYEFKNMGIGRIRVELQRRGISKDFIDDALAKYECEDQFERIEAFVRKKYDLSRLTDIKYRQKVYAGTIRAGFSSSEVGEFLRNFESE